MSDMIKAVIYARYSSHSQKDASIEQQIKACRLYAQQNDIRIVDEYSDHAVSGTSDKRPEFLRMIKDSTKKHWSKVLVYKVDRFARNRYDAAMYKARLKKNGVKVLSVMEPIPDGPEGILLEAVLEGSAEYYSANLSQNIKRGMEDNALACKVNNGRLPLGYVKGADGKYAIEPAEAEIVREIYANYAAGMNVSQIIKALNARAILTSHEARWNKNSLRSILKNERYTGVYIWKDIRIEGGIPQIISRELFEEVQLMREKISKAPASARSETNYLLTGKLFCGHCGSPMIGESGTGRRGTKYHYYTCASRKKGGPCKKKQVKKTWIERLIVQKTRDMCLTDKMIKIIVDTALALQEREKDDALLKSFEAELSEVMKSIRNILNAIEQGIFTSSTKARLEELESRKADLELAIEDEKTVQPQLTREQLTFWLQRFRSGDIDDVAYLESFIDVFISKIYLYDDNFRVVCNYGDSDGLTFDLINDIDSASERRAVFDFEALCSTNRGVSEHAMAYIYSQAFVFVCSITDGDMP